MTIKQLESWLMPGMMIDLEQYPFYQGKKTLFVSIPQKMALIMIVQFKSQSFIP